MGARFGEAIAADHYEADPSEAAPADDNDHSVAAETDAWFAAAAAAEPDGYPAPAGSGVVDWAPDDCSAAQVPAGRCAAVWPERYFPDDCLAPVDSSAAGSAAADWVEVDSVADGCSAVRPPDDHCGPVVQKVASSPDDC